MLLIFFKITKILKTYQLYSIAFIFFCISNLNSKDIKDIEIEIPINTDYKILRNALEAKSNNLITEKQKTSHKAVIKISNEKYDSKIRIHGDLVDHLDISNLIYSLDISLINGTIEGIKEFKILLSDTRPYEELLLNKILKELNYIVPHTEIVNVSFNDRSYKAIFIEKPNRFLLERLKIRDGPIYRGDERTWWEAVNKRLNHKNYLYPDYLTFRLSNKNFVRENLNTDFNFRISNMLFSIYGLDKIFFSNNIGLGEDFFCSLDKGCAYYKIVKKYSPHSLLPNNVIFYHDIYSNKLMPIYWDGGQRISDTCQKTKIKIDNQSSYNLFLKQVLNELSISNIAIKPETECIIMDAFSLFEEYSTFIKDIDYSNINKDKLIIKNPSQIIWYDYKKLIYETCESKDSINLKFISKTDCKIEKLNQKKFQDYLSGDFYQDKKIYEFVGSNSFEILDKFSNEYEILKCNKANCYFDLDKISIINLDKKNINKIDLKLKNIDARAIIVSHGSKIEEIDIRQDFNLDLDDDIHPITGCLTILNSSIEIDKIISSKSMCEDAINIVNSKGKINYLKIYDSQFDGLDSDFSEFNIAYMEIEKSLNDCADWSFSEWIIDKISIKDCFDKGLSIGEKSKIHINQESIIERANIGFAVKEGSLLNIEKELFIKKYFSDCNLTYIKKPYLGKIGKVDGKFNCQF